MEIKIRYMTKYRIVKWVGDGRELYFIKFKYFLFWHTWKWYYPSERVNHIRRYLDDRTILFQTPDEAEEYIRKSIRHEETVKTITVR